jgi:hypothetical protein
LRQFLDWEDSEVTLAISLNVPEMVNILKFAEYLASMSTYNIMLEVWEEVSFPHCTSRNNIYVKTRDIANIIN